MTAALLDVAYGFWTTLCQMAPYLLFGFLVAGVLSVVIRPEWVEHHLGRRRVGATLKAALFGVPLPLCSCGVIPVAASLRRHGAGKGATVSFLISTPQTGVDSIFVTYSLLGGVYAIFRPVAALVSGLVGGVLVTLFGGEGREAPENGGETCREACCDPDAAGGWLGRILRYGFQTLPQDIGRSLLIGLAAAGVISAVVPEDFFQQQLGTGLVAMLVMMALGIPIYVCATASVPIAAALIWKGATPGAALVFLMTGPATNAATLTTLWRTLGRRTTVIYLLSVAGSALASGLLLDRFLTAAAVPAPPHVHGDGVSWLGAVSAVVLLGVLAHALVRPVLAGGAREAEPEGEGMHLRMKVTGMTCSHCAANVTRALEGAPGVASARVDLGGGTAHIAGEALEADALRRAVEALGYGVGGVEPET